MNHPLPCILIDLLLQGVKCKLRALSAHAEGPLLSESRFFEILFSWGEQEQEEGGPCFVSSAFSGFRWMRSFLCLSLGWPRFASRRLRPWTDRLCGTPAAIAAPASR